MSIEAPVPCFKCGVTLKNAFEGAVNQPAEGTAFQTYGHYGSTFWDSMDGEQIIINICDNCLRRAAGSILRQKRYMSIRCGEWDVGRQWVTREMVPYFEGEEDYDSYQVDAEEIGKLKDSGGPIEWVDNWEELRETLLEEEAKQEEE